MLDVIDQGAGVFTLITSYGHSATLKWRDGKVVFVRVATVSRSVSISEAQLIANELAELVTAVECFDPTTIQ